MSEIDSRQSTAPRAVHSKECIKCGQKKLDDTEKTKLKKRLGLLPKVYAGVNGPLALAEIVCSVFALMRVPEETDSWILVSRDALSCGVVICIVLIALMLLLLIGGSQKNSYPMLAFTHICGQLSILFLVLFSMMNAKTNLFLFSSPFLILMMVVIISIVLFVPVIAFAAVCFSRQKKICKCLPTKSQSEKPTATPTWKQRTFTDATNRERTTTTGTRREEAPLKSRKPVVSLPIEKDVDIVHSVGEEEKPASVGEEEKPGSVAEEEKPKKTKPKTGKKKKGKKPRNDEQSDEQTGDQEKSSKAPSEKERKSPKQQKTLVPPTTLNMDEGYEEMCPDGKTHKSGLSENTVYDDCGDKSFEKQSAKKAKRKRSKEKSLERAKSKKKAKGKKGKIDKSVMKSVQEPVRHEKTNSQESIQPKRSAERVALGAVPSLDTTQMY